MFSIQLWFGDFQIDNGNVVCSTIVQKEVSSILNRIKSGEISKLDRNYRNRLRGIALSSGFVTSKVEYNKILRDVMIELAREKIAEAESQRDQQIVQSVESVDDIDESINLLSERLSEWQGFKFGYLKGEELETAIVSSEHTEQDAASKLASAIVALRETRGQIADHIFADMRAIAPNLANVAGELLAARLISKAGGLDNLAKMPSSTVQVMGASKALFKHLRYGTKPPKHGIIYQHPLISKSQASQRGKIARALASKISIAARLDNFSNNLNPELLTDLEKKVEHIKNLSHKCEQENEH